MQRKPLYFNYLYNLVPFTLFKKNYTFLAFNIKKILLKDNFIYLKKGTI